MGLLNPNDKRNQAYINTILAKTKKPTVSKAKTPAVKRGGSLLDKINNVCAQTQSRLGKYKEEFELIQTKQRLHEYIDKCIENNIIDIDTETTGLDPITDQIVGACIYTPGEKAAYIPINHISYITNVRLDGQLTNEEVAEEFQRLVDLNVQIIMFNAKFDIRVIRHQLGVYMTPAWDGFIAGKCLKENEEEGNLKYLWKKYCSPDKEAEHFTFEKMFEGICFNLIPITTAYLYAAKDALMTHELYEFQKPYLTETDEKCKALDMTRLARLYREIELPIITTIADIEDRGVHLNVPLAREMSVEYHKLMDAQLDKFYTELEKYRNQINSYLSTHPQTKLEDPINIGSPTQLAELFYDVLQVSPPDKRNPRGTGVDILKAMKHPLCDLILEYRGTQKLLSTYIDKLPEVLNKATHKIHAAFKQYGADCVTGESCLVTDKGFFTIEQLLKDICKESGKYYDIDINVINMHKQFEKATKGIMYKDVPTIKITTDYGYTIEGTYNHPVIVSKYTSEDWKNHHQQIDKNCDFWDNKYFKNLEDLKIGDYIEIPKDWSIVEQQYIPTGFNPNEKLTHKTTCGIIPNYYDEEFSEFLGIYHADGHYTCNTDGARITISNCDIEVYDRVNYLCKKLFGVEATRHIYDEQRKQVCIKCNVTHAKDVLSILCFGALNKEIPQQIKQSRPSVIKAYLKGMTLDSGVPKRTYKITVNKKEDALFIQMFCASQGILCGVTPRFYKYKGRLTPHYSVNFNPTFYRKFLKLVGTVQSNKVVTDIPLNNRYKNTEIQGSFRARVKKIEHGINTVWDLHVPGTHSFLCNSMINHNTGRFASADPNLQNIPSHVKKIRTLFISDREYFTKTDENNNLNLLWGDVLDTPDGRKFIMDLVIGDKIKTEEGYYDIINIEFDGNLNYKLTIRKGG